MLSIHAGVVSERSRDPEDEIVAGFVGEQKVFRSSEERHRIAQLPHVHRLMVYTYAMPKRLLTAAEAARALGISLDTLRRWDKAGKIRVQRDSANRRVVAASEVARLKGAGSEELSARNRFRGVVRSVELDGLLAKVEIDVTEPARVVAIITRESAEELQLRTGMSAAGVVKATSVMVER
jgi:molybdopterin-binding protein